MSGSWWPVAGIVVVFLALLALVATLVLGSTGPRAGGRHSGRRPPRDTFRHGEPPRKKRAAVIVNPTKFDDLDAVRAQVTTAAVRLGWAEPLFLETTADDPGFGQTRAALEADVDVVCPLGGDGTVRAVGQVLAGSGMPMGLLPGGTGNLLARNLTVPVKDLDHAVEVALTGRNRHLDVGWLTVDPTREQLGDLARRADEGSRDTSTSRWPWTTHRHRAKGGARSADETSPELAGKVSSAPADEVAPSDADAVAAHPELEEVERPQEVRPEQPDPEPAAEDQPDAGLETRDETDPHESDAQTDHAPGAPPPNVHAFLVMAGLGFDAVIMDDTSEELKAKMGWTAYVASGMRNLVGERFKAHLSLDGARPETVHARTVLIGNCGTLTGGITILPEAEPDDSTLDVAVLSPKGIAGWAGLAAHVLKGRQDDHSRLERMKAENVLVTVTERQKLEVDGDVLGDAHQVLATVQPSCLIVRVGYATSEAREEIGPDKLAAE